MGRQVSVKERLFARYVAEGRTQAESARMAGYTGNADKKGCELVRKPQVVDLLNQRGSEVADMDSPTVILDRLNGLLSRDRAASQD